MALRAVVSLNNEAVRLFELGELGAAKDFMQLSIDELFELTCDGIEESSFQREASMLNYEELNIVQGWSRPSCSVTVLVKEETFAYVFSRAILLKEPSIQDSWQVQREEENQGGRNTHASRMKIAKKALDFFQVFTLFNRALICHSIALQEGECRQLMEATYRLYEDVFSCSERIKRLARDAHLLHTLDILALALFNNMGVMFYQNMARFDASFQCFHAARGLILRIELHSMPGDMVLDDDEVVKLSTNICMVPLCTTPAA
jgi:hypothetical protein